MSSLSDIGEQEAIRLITACLASGDNVVKGPGDDCAVVRLSSKSDTDLLLTSDPVIENIHFDSQLTPENMGHKAIGRVLSDLAAMGAEPNWALINVTAPEETKIFFIEQIMSAASALATKYGMSISGGDIARNDKIELHVFGVGSAPRNRSVLRGTASTGDLIYITGSLGGSRAGHHCSFDPRINEGLFLRDWATSMIDVTDGLATDLRHLLNDSSGAVIRSFDIPLSETADGIRSALIDGEDFELMFTVNPDRQETFEIAWKASQDTAVTMIGRITDDAENIDIENENGSIIPLTEEGYQHF